MSVEIYLDSYGLGKVEFSYLGKDDLEIWCQVAEGILAEPETDKPFTVAKFNGLSYSLSRAKLRRLREFFHSPSDILQIERVIAQVQRGEWGKIDLDFEVFKEAIPKVWRRVNKQPSLWFEAEVREALEAGDNGGLTVEQVIMRLWSAGVRDVSFKRVRDALGHLCILYQAECHSGQFSVRQGMS